MSLCCFLLLLVCRVVLELEQYATKGCPDLADFERQYVEVGRNKFWVAEKKVQGNSQIIGCIGLIINPASPQDAQLVRLVVSPGHRGAGVGSRLLSAALGFAASCRCRSIEVCANSLNASSARFLRNRQFELFQVVKRNLMRGDLLRWRMWLDSEGRPMEPKPDPPFGTSGLQAE
ncbi:acetyltransferase domain-containing protein [Cyclospora cayetanensis]|nr:acetyltransferase domain-containing protein [Cyclospora cayetanensis]